MAILKVEISQGVQTLNIIGGISIVCFAASYAVAFCLELSRLFFRISMRTAIMIGFMVAGVVAHSIYLGREAQDGLAGGAPLSSWYHGCLIVAWLLALVFVVISLRQKPTSIGLIFLPTILCLVGVAQVFPKSPQLSSEDSYRLWSISHGVALLLGTAAVVVGFVSGLLYLLQTYRLKHKIVSSRGLRLPSLEKLQHISENALIASSLLLTVGLSSGILLNWRRGGEATLPWTDPVVWPSAVLLIWLIAALTFNAFYKPARQGHKVAYLTFASFVFLGLVLAIIILVPSSHGGKAESVAAFSLNANSTSRGLVAALPATGGSHDAT